MEHLPGLSPSELPRHLSTKELEAGLSHILLSPKDSGALLMIVRRPAEGARELLKEAQLDLVLGLVGDTWKARGSTRTPDGSANPEAQLTIMNARAIDLIAQVKEHWPLAGDQLYVDLDLSHQNLPAGTRLALGTAIVEVSHHPHTGCKKFVARFGLDAMHFVNSPTGKTHRLRGLNAKVISPGIIRVGDVARKVKN